MQIPVPDAVVGRARDRRRLFWEGRNRELNLDGHRPRGVVYIGGEITERMQLGLVAKGLANLALKFVKARTAFLHHSYGDKEDRQLAHIVMPLWSSVDRLVVTPQGGTPPPLGEGALPEPDAERLVRRASSDAGEWETDATYSFSFKTGDLLVVRHC